MSSESAHQWVVAELKRLDFDGDCDALAQYVEALIDNNREMEEGDPELLRKQVNTDLVDFIGEDRAAEFVTGLIRYLSNLATTDPSPIATVTPSADLDTHNAPSPDITKSDQPSTPLPVSPMGPAKDHISDGNHRPQIDQPRRARSPRAQGRDRNERNDRNGDRDRERIRARDREHLRERDYDRDRVGDRHRDRNRDQLRDRASDHINDKARGRPNDRPQERPQEHSTGRAVDRSNDRIREHPHERTRVRPSDRLAERPRDHHTERLPNRDENVIDGVSRQARPSVMSRLGTRIGSKAQNSYQAAIRDDRDDRVGRVRLGHEEHLHGRTEPGREEHEHLKRIRDHNGTVHRSEDSTWRGRLGSKPGKRARDETEGSAESIESRAVKVSRAQSEARRPTEASIDDKNVPSNLSLDRRVSGMVPSGPMNGPKPIQTPGFDPLRPFPWPAPSDMINRLAMPFPPFAPPPFAPAGRGTPPVIPSNSSNVRGRVNVTPTTMPGAQGSSSRHKHFILLARNIPEDKMMIGPIIAFFQRFGMILDVVRVPPDRSFILFERRENASAALNSVDAVMGNRHIRLAWARDSDFAEANLSLTSDGKLVPCDKTTVSGPSALPRRATIEGTVRNSTPPRRVDSGLQNMGPNSMHRNGQGDFSVTQKPNDSGGQAQATVAGKTGPHMSANGTPPQQTVDAEAAAEDLRRKKEKIVAMRKEQEARRAQLQKQYENLVKKQKVLLDQVVKVQDKEAADVLKTQLREVQEEAMKVRSELHPQVGAKRKAADAQASVSPTKRFRKPDVSSFVVDNRPKNVLVTGASTDVSEDKARSVFRETMRVARVEEGWLIAFATRRAAESALRAIGPLKRGFGNTSAIQIVSTSLPHVPKSPATKSVNGSAAEASDGRTARKSTDKSGPRSVVESEPKPVVESGPKGAGKSGPRSIEVESTLAIGPAAITRAMSNVATKK